MRTKACFAPEFVRDGEPAAADHGRTREAARALREVLEHAIRLGGSSVSDYVDADGVRGFFPAGALRLSADRRAVPEMRERDQANCGGWTEHALLRCRCQRSYAIYCFLKFLQFRLTRIQND